MHKFRFVYAGGTAEKQVAKFTKEMETIDVEAETVAEACLKASEQASEGARLFCWLNMDPLPPQEG